MSKRRQYIKRIFIGVLLIIIFVVAFNFIHKYRFTKKIKDYEKNNPPMISWIDDDGYYSFYTKMYPLALKYEIPMASAIIAGRDHENNPRYYNIQQAKEMQANGIEILNHGYLHSLDLKPGQMSSVELEEDYRKSIEFAEEHGFLSNIHVYPFGDIGGEVANKSPINFDYAFAYKSNSGPVTKPFDRYAINRIYTDDYSSLENIPLDEIYSQLDRAANNSSWIIVTSHIDQTGKFSEEYYSSIIKYAKDKGFDFVSIEEGYERYKQFEMDWFIKFKRNIKAKIF
ncbi:MAG: polysaccharide deacetylase family protein [Tissierellia bacterium]|nr:polysaccharide deacetylase family protein [Tissierellia bacterium]